MPCRKFVFRVFIAAVAILGVWVVYPAAPSAATDSTVGDDGMEVLTRGPIHEAFADVSVNEAMPAAVIRRIVPEPINEVPPDYRPEGDTIQWISGYWSWDDEQNDFVWVSGIWRDVPPGRQWIPGYWIAVEGGSRFVSGYWTDIEEPETVYLPPPPEPLPAAAGTYSASSDALWVDGHWLWSGNGYVWQAGYWQDHRPDMIWNPAHYVWTPRGHVFVRGYWDYQFNRRGLLFAPRYYPRPSYKSHGYHYTPSIALSIDSVFLSLFIRKNHHHYYFGDYFDHRYERRGFLPWYSRHATRYGFDPCYRSHRWHQMRHNKHWEHNYHQQYQFRRDHRETRPPALYRSQVSHNSGRSLTPPEQLLGRPLAEVVETRDQPVRFTRLNSEHKRDFQTRERRLAAFQAERRNVEMAPERERRSDFKRAERIRLSTSPIVDRSGRETFSGKRQAEQDNRRTNQRQRTLTGPKERNQEAGQPVKPVYRSKDNDQPQTRQLNQQFSRQRTQPGKVESRKFVQPRAEQQRTRLREGKDQPGFQPRVQQQSRSIQKVEDRSRGRFQDYRQSQTNKVESRKFVQPQVSEKRRQHRRFETQDNIRPRVDRQQSRSRKFTGQKSDSPRTKQFTRQPRQNTEQMRGKPQVSEQKGKRQNRSGEHRRHRNR